MKRKGAAVAALAAALLLQLTVVNGLALPSGGTPDLVLLCVVALGLVSGPASGLTGGFIAGLALDLAPPAYQLAGQYALVFCLVGYGSGRLRFTLRHSAVLAIAAAAMMAALGEAMAATLTLALGAPEVTWATVKQVLPPSVVYDAVLCPLVLLCWVRSAIALGVNIDLRDDSPALEPGGSAAPTTVVGAAVSGRPVPRQAGQRLAVGGDWRAAASGRWLVGDVAEAAPSVGAIGWLAGSDQSRRARRRQARLTAMVTGARRRKGALWVGWRPPGLVLAGRPVAVIGRERAPRPVRLGLADERRRRARAARRVAERAGARSAGGLIRPLIAREPHGTDAHGVSGPGLPSISFGTGSLPGAGRVAGRSVPRIAFGTGSLPGAGRVAGRGVPRIAFGTGSLPGAGGAAGGVAGRGVPRIAFGTGSLPGTHRRARQVPRIAFGTGSLPGSHPRARQVPRIAFGTGSLPGAGRARARQVPRIAFSASGTSQVTLAGSGRVGAGRSDGWVGQGPLDARTSAAPRIRLALARPRITAPRFRAAPRFASGQWLAGSAVAAGGFGLWAAPGGSRTPTGNPGTYALSRPIRKAKRPRFARSSPGHQLARSRRPKTARMSAGRRSLRRIPWLRRPGDRSTVWRIGSRRTGGYR